MLMNGSELMSRSEICLGGNCRIGAGCVFLDADFHGLGVNERDQVGITEPIAVGNNVWLGRGVTVLKGVHIGDDAVVGAGCVVSKSIPAGGIAVGNPMRVVGSVYDRDA
jgi:maltose O-acetyltransferase